MAGTTTVKATELRPGDVVRSLPRDHTTHPLTVGRARIDQARLCKDGSVSVVWQYASRRCTGECYAAPYSCPHFGEAGGGSGGLRGDQDIEVFATPEVPGE